MNAVVIKTPSCVWNLPESGDPTENRHSIYFHTSEQTKPPFPGQLPSVAPLCLFPVVSESVHLPGELCHSYPFSAPEREAVWLPEQQLPGSICKGGQEGLSLCLLPLCTCPSPRSRHLGRGPLLKDRDSSFQSFCVSPASHVVLSLSLRRHMR